MNWRVNSILSELNCRFGRVCWPPVAVGTHTTAWAGICIDRISGRVSRQEFGVLCVRPAPRVSAGSTRTSARAATTASSACAGTGKPAATCQCGTLQKPCARQGLCCATTINGEPLRLPVVLDAMRHRGRLRVLFTRFAVVCHDRNS